MKTDPHAEAVAVLAEFIHVRFDHKLAEQRWLEGKALGGKPAHLVS